MTKAQEEVAMELLGLTEPPALVRIHLTDGSGGADLYDAAGALLGSVLIDADGNVSLP
jgi:hypothetical protein